MAELCPLGQRPWISCSWFGREGKLVVLLGRLWYDTIDERSLRLRLPNAEQHEANKNIAYSSRSCERPSRLYHQCHSPIQCNWLLPSRSRSTPLMAPPPFMKARAQQLQGSKSIRSPLPQHHRPLTRVSRPATSHRSPSIPAPGRESQSCRRTDHEVAQLVDTNWKQCLRYRSVFGLKVFARWPSYANGMNAENS